MFEKIRLINQLLSNFRRDGCEELPLVMNVMLENLSIVVNYICAATKFPPWVFRPEWIYVVCILICFQATAHGKVVFTNVCLPGGALRSHVLQLAFVVPSAESVPAPRFEPGTSDSKAKTIPLHKRV